MLKKIIPLLSALAIVGWCGPVNAGAIISPDSVIASNSFPDATFGNPDNLINHGGLLTDFVSGVTDFDTYIAGNPQHTIISSGAEWFTDSLETGATLTFNMGSLMFIDGLALWNDEFWGAGLVEVLLSTDNVTYTSVGSFAPTDWLVNVTSYGADVFSFSSTSTQYVQLALSNCPQPNSIAGGGCGLGEFAVRAAMGAQVPEPGTIALFGLGLLGLGFTRRKKA